MTYEGSRIDGGFHVVKVDLPVGATDLVPELNFQDTGKFKAHGLVIALLIWTRGAATTMRLINRQTNLDGVGGGVGPADGTIIMPDVDSNLLLERPAFGSEDGHTIEIFTAGGLSQLLAILVPEKQHQEKIVL